MHTMAHPRAVARELRDGDSLGEHEIARLLVTLEGGQGDLRSRLAQRIGIDDQAVLGDIVGIGAATVDESRLPCELRHLPRCSGAKEVFDLKEHSIRRIAYGMMTLRKRRLGAFMPAVP